MAWYGQRCFFSITKGFTCERNSIFVNKDSPFLLVLIKTQNMSHQNEPQSKQIMDNSPASGKRPQTQILPHLLYRAAQSGGEMEEIGLNRVILICPAQPVVKVGQSLRSCVKQPRKIRGHMASGPYPCPFLLWPEQQTRLGTFKTTLDLEWTL